MKYIQTTLCAFFCLVIANAAWIKQTHQNVEQQQINYENNYVTGSASLLGNFSKNMTDQQLRYVTNAIAAAQRKYNYTQLQQIAASVSKSLANVFNIQYWSVLALSNETKQIGVAITSKDNKVAVFVSTGTYKLSYVAFQIPSIMPCTKPKKFTNNNTDRSQVFGPTADSVDIQKIRAIVNSASTYGGDNLTQNAEYISKKVPPAIYNLYPWNVVITDPSALSGSFFCTMDDNWSMFTKYSDFKWNYYMGNIYK